MTMNLHSEMVDEHMDDAFDEDEDEDDVDNVTSQVLLEAGIQLPEAGQRTPATLMSLEERLEKLQVPANARS